MLIHVETAIVYKACCTYVVVKPLLAYTVSCFSKYTAHPALLYFLQLQNVEDVILYLSGYVQCMINH